MAKVKSAAFKKASARAVRDEGIQHALTHVMDHFTEARAEAIATDYSDESWEAMRTRAAAIKAHTIGNLDYYLDLADRSVRRNGGHVHFADDAAAATQIVIDIAKRH
ncbi:MAG: lactate utilization protein, partial [Chloroflexi bacterium]|nr:lactate utilization protein [Chloroflexota bacterium]